jgi:carboxymethylenebutenolidase
VTVPDGEFDLPLWLPSAPAGPGLVLIQEIYGLDGYLKSVASELASLGYVVAVPDLFWREAPNWSSGHDERGLAASMDVASRFDPKLGLSDVLASLRHLRELPEVEGGVGVFGFCLGGSLAFEAAAKAEPDVAVSFYGSSVPDEIGLLPDVTCPVQFHFGGQDPYIPRARIQLVIDAVAANPGAEIHIQEQAGHAFHNHVSPMFHNAEAAAVAWRLTTGFLARTLPTPS